MTDFGTDLYSFDDLDETRQTSGVELVATDSVWRFKTTRAAGILAADAPDYGLDLLEVIGAVSDDDDVASLPDRIRLEAVKDQRILKCEASVARSIVGPVASYAIRIACQTDEGPFELVGTADSETLQLEVRLLPGGV